MEDILAARPMASKPKRHTRWQLLTECVRAYPSVTILPVLALS